MTPDAARIQKTYLSLSFLSNFSASVVRGVDALFLLSAGLSLSQVFTVYAFMTAGTLLFEIPTGAVADARGRRYSYLIGVFLLAASTAGFWFMWQQEAHILWFASASFLTGIAYTFFSGATEAWLVDALKATKYSGKLDAVFAKNQIVFGGSMLSGTLLGGLVAQLTNIGAPYILRIILLLLTFVVAFRFMHDQGFTPDRSVKLIRSMKQTIATSVRFGLKIAPIKWVSISGAISFAAMGFIFYGMQPYLLELYGDSTSYFIAALGTTITSMAQMLGGVMSGPVKKLFAKRTHIMIASIIVSSLAVISLYFNDNFYVAIGVIMLWSSSLAVIFPIRQALLNELIDSKHRATILSVDSLVTSSGGIPTQPLLGRIAQSASFGHAFLAAGMMQLFAIPFLFIAARLDSPADRH